MAYGRQRKLHAHLLPSAAHNLLVQCRAELQILLSSLTVATLHHYITNKAHKILVFSCFASYTTLTAVLEYLDINISIIAKYGQVMHDVCMLYVLTI